MNKLYNTEWHFSLILSQCLKHAKGFFLNQQPILPYSTIYAKKTQIHTQ